MARARLYRVVDRDGYEVGGSEDVAGLAAMADHHGGVVISPDGSVVYDSSVGALGPSPDNPQEGSG